MPLMKFSADLWLMCTSIRIFYKIFLAVFEKKKKNKLTVR